MKALIGVLLAVVAIAVAVAAAWSFLSRSFPGERTVMATDLRPLSPFSRIVIEGQADVNLVQGDTESLAVEASQRQLRSIRTEVSNGTLTIASERSSRWWTELFSGGTRPVRVTITFRQIDAIDASGTVKIRADRVMADQFSVTASGATSLRVADLDTRKLQLSGKGAMKVELTGRAVTQVVSISGAGDYRAEKLASDEAQVRVSGAGRVVVNVEKTLKIDLSGAGKVEYIGDPVVTQRISGAGRVKRRDAAETAPLFAFKI